MQITNVMAVSLDGKIASHPGETDRARRALGFTNDDDRQHMLELVREADAVIVGKSSVMASGGVFEGLNDRGRHPIWVVPTNAGIPASARFLRQVSVPRWLVSKTPLAELPEQETLRNVVYGDRSPVHAIVDALAEAGLERVLLFGGSEVNRQFYKEGLVDQLILTLCPLIVGAQAAVPLVAPELPAPVSFHLVASNPKGDLVFLTYKVRKN